jgi:hypothetical protein
MNSQMTPQQALQLLDNVTSQINLPRVQHAQIVEALNVLTAAIQQASTQTPKEE